ncbi:tetratricopeptide repeat-containing sulfotransferase family protein [Qipengyuania sphaerica]|uniref:tetratricopeptide repeat-containing sulfotransferase family protein n=1 Tax=Qipengyuania sphaerica TaxID=2867243 RepID=UPI001C888010|nr:tetratricopeptide repeat-containing sulfotransferase family protein [Qipengyuania sphaerica]MBX7539957.1 sulfotransferase [Qipengyuania sphaerica]
MSASAPPPPPQLMAAMQAMRSGNLPAALAAAETALEGDGDRAPFLALGSLAALRMGQPDKAIPMLRELIVLNPEDRPSRNNLAAALVEIGDFDGALEISAGQADPALARIEGYVHQQRGDEAKAALAYQRAIDGDAADLASLNNLANIRTGQERFDEAIALFERAITLAPADVNIYLNLGDCLRIADRATPRVKVLQDARSIAPDDGRVLTELGMALTHADDLEGALPILRRAIELSDDFGEAHVEYGMILEKLNRLDELAEFVARYDNDQAPPEATYLFAWEARRAGDFEKAAELADMIPDYVLPNHRWHLVGGIADRLGNTDKAFAAFEKMNAAAQNVARPLSGPSYREQVKADLELWTKQWRESWSEPDVPSDAMRDPIFLVGFPRSGTTLLDTMLMGLDELSVLEERPMVARIRSLTRGEDLAKMDADRIAELRSTYFELARAEGYDDSRWLVDKHPLNMQRVPLIKRLFPQARFILAERHPYDVVLSCFMANFRGNIAMRSFTDLEEAAKTYDAVWQAWHRALDLFDVDWRAVRYERLVQDPRAELEPLVEWLDLEWNDRMVDHTETAKNRGRVRTASYAQIGEGLYTHASERWRRYEGHLEPVLPILKPWAERMDYAPN